MNLKSDKRFIKTLFFWHVILTPFRLVGEFGGWIVSALFPIFGFGSFFIVGLWGFAIILLLIPIWFLLMRMFEALENILKDDSARAIGSFFFILKYEGWTKETERLYYMLKTSDVPEEMTLKSLIMESITIIEDEYANNPNGVIFTEVRSPIPPSDFSTLKKPYYAVWLYEKILLL